MNRIALTRYALAKLRRTFLHGVVGSSAWSQFGMSRLEYMRLYYSPKNRYMRSQLLKRTIELTDPLWYLHSYREIFVEQIYLFSASRPNPRILDCGANIGLSVIFFKSLYPQSEITALEPDNEIFEVLERNIASFGLNGVSAIQAAAWKSDGVMQFCPDGSVGGRLIIGPDILNSKLRGRAIQVPTVRLRSFLDQRVDLLKIDIEGAEYDVLLDCQNHLQKVEKIFIEFHGQFDSRQTLHEMLHILHTNGFRYHIKEANPVSHPFVTHERERYYDLQLNVFGFRPHQSDRDA